MDEFDREAPLFEGVLPFKLYIGEKDGRSCELTLRVLSGYKAGNRTSKALTIEVTDEREPFFIHSLALGEAEFASLKTEQSILVDFSAFHTNLIELLHHCLASKGQQHPRFYCSLSGKDDAAGSPSVLSIIETNQFKQLTHIQLGLRSGNDAAIKRYLAARLAQSQAALSRTQAALHSARADSSANKEACDSTAAELSRLRLEHDGVVARERREGAASLAQVKEAAAREQAEAERRFREQLSDLQARYEGQLSELRRHTEDLSQQRAVGSTTAATLEASLRETQARLRTSEAQLASAREECDIYKAASQKALAERTELERSLAAASTQVAVLGQQTSDLRDLVAATQAQLRVLEGSKSNLETTLAHYKETFAKQTSKLELMEREIVKANGIIEGQHEELRTAKAKSKAKTEIARAAEDRANEKERSIMQLQQEQVSLKSQLEYEKANMAQATSTISALKRQLAESKDSIEKDQQVIAWLNKELTEMSTAPQDPRARPTKIPQLHSSVTHAVGPSVSMSASRLGQTSLSSTGNPSQLSVQVSPAPLPQSSAAGNSNPYLSGTLPLGKALEQLQTVKTSSYFPNSAGRLAYQSPVPGGGS